MKRRLLVFIMTTFWFGAFLAECQTTASHPISPPGMDPFVKDLFDVIAKVFGLITVIAGAIGVYLQIRKNREERSQKEALRREELRWRKAGLAREVINEIYENPQAAAAMRMLDWTERSYRSGGKTFSITYSQMYSALRIENTTFNNREIFIRDCFDAFFHRMQLTEHYLRVGLLVFEDVRYPNEYYADLMSENPEVFYQFLIEYKYDYALSFLRRFPSWKKLKIETDASKGSGIKKTSE